MCSGKIPTKSVFVDVLSYLANGFPKTHYIWRPPIVSDLLIPGNSCSSLWLPTFTIRNIEEYPQGRSQPSHMAVLPGGIVTWRTQLSAHFYTPMDMQAFVCPPAILLHMIGSLWLVFCLRVQLIMNCGGITTVVPTAE